LGYAAFFFLIPRMESITSLIILAGAGAAFAGWIASGTDHISYAGLQAAFAFYLCIFQGFAPEVNFTTARDRLVGIILGIFVSSVVFRFIWPVHAVDALRITLARLLRGISQLIMIPEIGAAIGTERKTAHDLHATIVKDLESAMGLSELVAVENAIINNQNRLSPSVLERITTHAQALTLITNFLVGSTKLEEWQRLDKTAQQAEMELRTGAADQLMRVAVFVEGGRPAKSSNLEPAFTSWNHAVSGITGNDRPRLVRRMAEQVRFLTPANGAS